MSLSPYLDRRINQELDRNLIPCPNCHNEYNDPHKRRRGPTCVDKFEGDKVHIICLNCWTIGEPAKDQHGANDNWNAGRLVVKNAIPEVSEIRKLRKAAGLTQRALAEMAGLSENVVQKCETGRKKISTDSAKQILKALGVGL